MDYLSRKFEKTGLKYGGNVLYMEDDTLAKIITNMKHKRKVISLECKLIPISIRNPDFVAKRMKINILFL